MSSPTEAKEYYAPFLGRTSAHEKRLITGFGFPGIIETVRLMTTFGKYNPRELEVPRNITNPGQLQLLLSQIWVVVNTHIENHSLDDIRTVVVDLPREIYFPWNDFTRAVLATIGVNYLRDQGCLGTARLVAQPDVMHQLLLIPPMIGVSIAPVELTISEGRQPNKYRIPDLMTVETGRDKAEVTGAYNFETTSRYHAWRSGNQERGVFGNDITRALLSLAIVRACDLNDTHPLTLPSQEALSSRLVVAENMSDEAFKQAKDYLKRRGAFAYSDIPSSLGFSSPYRVSWFVLSIMTGKLGLENDWNKYFTPLST